MANTSSAYSTLSGLVVPTQAAAIYAAFDSSLFLSGQLIPTISVPVGSTSAQVPLMSGAVTVDNPAAGADLANEDVTLSAITAAGTNIVASTYAARAVMRNIGSPDANNLGVHIGHAISKAYDADVMAQLLAMTLAGGVGNTPVATGGALTMDKLFEAVEAIRTQGETGQLFGIITPAMAHQLMSTVAGANFAGGDYQGEALRNGFVGSAAGIQLFQSSHTATDGVIFGGDCARQAQFSPMSVTITEAPTKLGVDIVGSLYQGSAVIDSNRGVVITAA
jgi:hypothetical protein